MDDQLPRELRAMLQSSPDITSQLAHHDAAINALSGRMTGVENGLRTLQGEVNHGFTNITQSISGLGSKLDRLDAQPKFDFHQIVRTVASLTVLFGAVCGGIIYITQAQSSATIAEQKVFNSGVTKLLEKHDMQIDKINSWAASMTVARASK